jgi:hypothetical protein
MTKEVPSEWMGVYDVQPEITGMSVLTPKSMVAPFLIKETTKVFSVRKL